MFVLINSIISVFCILLDSMLGTVWSIGYGPIYIGYGLAVFVPGLAVAIRRLHDIDKRGWWIFISVIPVIGWVFLIILHCQEGNIKENRFGVKTLGAE